MNNRSELLKDKVIVVTGGNGLLGRAMISDLKSKGAIAISADISVISNFEEYTIQADLRTSGGIKEALTEIIKDYKRVDGWVNNAYPRTSDWASEFLDMTEDSLKTNVDWQMNSYILCCQEVIRIMIEQRHGSIVNLASIYGVVGNDFTIYENTKMLTAAPYAAIKGGIINFTRFLASRYGQYNVRINTVSPGGIFDNQPEPFVNAYNHKVPMKRMGNPDDIAPSVSFLLSEEAKYITGQNLIVDGGWTAI
jgi:NAD(P)-dependent dehydrogenase (short-subunit alcohol dehydrogenase family)